MTTYCPRCWAEVERGAHRCPHCQADLQTDARTYAQKLIDALAHPDPLTQRRAAYVLGRLRCPAAVEALGAVLAGQADPYTKGEAAHALAAIGGEEARAILLQVSRDETQPSMVRRVAGSALRADRSSEEQDLGVGDPHAHRDGEHDER